MYQPAPNLTAWLIAVSGTGSIIIGIMLLRAAREGAALGWSDWRVKSDGVMGVRLILAGVLVLIAYAAWRLM